MLSLHIITLSQEYVRVLRSNINKMKRQILISTQVCFTFIHVLKNAMMHHTIYCNRKGVLKTSIGL